ncbi:hypothetical protein [Parazoarcus communis]|nr:hypothetical protein [Parazoarcus communis]
MKVFKLLAPFLLAGAATAAAANSMGAAPSSGTATQIALAPVAMMVVPTTHSNELRSGDSQAMQSEHAPSDEGDFNLALAGALMVGMVVLKRFSR